MPRQRWQMRRRRKQRTQLYGFLELFATGLVGFTKWLLSHVGVKVLLLGAAVVAAQKFGTSMFNPETAAITQLFSFIVIAIVVGALLFLAYKVDHSMERG